MNLRKILICTCEKPVQLKIFISLVLLAIVVLPVYAQEQSEETVLPTDKGTINVGLSTIPDQPNPDQETKFKINFLNKNTNSIQEHVDYSITVKKGESQVFSIPLTHTAIGSVTIPYQFEEAGKYQVSVDVQGIVFQPIPTETASFVISVGEESQSKNGCLIATAAFGSEMAPQVQFLREYRDNTIMLTSVGSSFINAFNAVYYTFSPTVADVERNNPILQEVVRVGVTPLLGILQVTKLSSIESGETSVLTSGMIASSFIGATYLWPAGLATKSIREGSRYKIKITLIVISIVLLLTLISSVIGNAQIMMISTSALVLSFVGTGAMFSSWAIWKIIQKVKIIFL